MLLFSPSHSVRLARAVADQLGIQVASSEEREFDGGEHKMRPLQDVRGQDVYVIQSLCGDEHASANDRMCRLLFFAAALKDAGASKVTACVPYLAYARKDRRTQPNDPVTIRYVASLFEASQIDRVIVLDVHNEAAFDNAFRRETIRLEAMESFADYLAPSLGTSDIVVGSPDIGGIKRAQRFGDALSRRLARDVGFAFMEKRRAAGIVSGEAFIGQVEGCDLILFDDMIASGGTIMRAVAAAKCCGAKRVLVAASHAAFLPSATQLFEEQGPDAVLVTDSISIRPAFIDFLAGRLQVCSVAPLLARTIAALAGVGIEHPPRVRSSAR